MLALMLSALLAQDATGSAGGATPASGKPDRRAVEALLVEDWDDQQVRAALSTFKKQIQGRAPLQQRVAAAEALARGRNRRLVQPLAEIARNARGLTVRRTAARALGHQPPKQARPAILGLIRSEGLQKEPLILADLVGALDRAGYTSRDWKVIDGLFEQRFGPTRVPLQQAILKLIAHHKETKAIDLLLRHLGEPIPEFVDDPSNPPAEYWERRWKAWQVWRDDVKAALFAITQQRFSTPEEARTWLHKNGKKIGIR